MNRLTKEHINALVFCAAIIAIMGVLYGYRGPKGTVGFLDAVSAELEFTEHTYENSKEQEALTNLVSIEKPKLVIDPYATYMIDTAYCLDDVISVTDAAGNVLNYTIESINKSSGENAGYLYTPDTNRIVFDRAGVFEMQILAMDENRIKIREKVKFVVNR